jgi:hypothetical protein
MSQMIENKMKDLMAKMDRQMERKGEVDRATFDEFAMYHRLWNEIHRIEASPKTNPQTRASSVAG